MNSVSCCSIFSCFTCSTSTEIANQRGAEAAGSNHRPARQEMQPLPPRPSLHTTLHLPTTPLPTTQPLNTTLPLPSIPPSMSSLSVTISSLSEVSSTSIMSSNFIATSFPSISQTSPPRTPESQIIKPILRTRYDSPGGNHDRKTREAWSSSQPSPEPDDQKHSSKTVRFAEQIPETRYLLSNGREILTFVQYNSSCWSLSESSLDSLFRKCDRLSQIWTNEILTFDELVKLSTVGTLIHESLKKFQKAKKLQDSFEKLKKETEKAKCSVKIRKLLDETYEKISIIQKMIGTSLSQLKQHPDFKDRVEAVEASVIKAQINLMKLQEFYTPPKD